MKAVHEVPRNGSVFCINTEKTVTLQTGAESISPSPVERLLGLQVGFGHHLVKGRDSLLCSLTTRINTLKLISKVANFKTCALP